MAAGGFDWEKSLSGFLVIQGAMAAHQFLVEQIAPLQDIEEKRRAFSAWQANPVQKAANSLALVRQIERELIGKG
ncbi:MAG: hypothetical protein PHU43_01840 [Candidatus Bipolaricaulis sp.]|nr:hypothetical protein [Candidatus Bipolaricaulis sp.]